jgi:hypothetical protein
VARLIYRVVLIVGIGAALVAIQVSSGTHWLGFALGLAGGAAAVLVARVLARGPTARTRRIGYAVGFLAAAAAVPAAQTTGRTQAVVLGVLVALWLGLLVPELVRSPEGARWQG